MSWAAEPEIAIREMAWINFDLLHFPGRHNLTHQLFTCRFIYTLEFTFPFMAKLFLSSSVLNHFFHLFLQSLQGRLPV